MENKQEPGRPVSFCFYLSNEEYKIYKKDRSRFNAALKYHLKGIIKES